LQRLLSETGIRPSPIAWIEIFEFLDCLLGTPRPRGLYWTKVMPSSRQVANTPLTSTSRDQSEYSLCKAATSGHQSVRVTEKHYNPWVRSRQEQLEADVRNAWANDATLKMTGTNQVQIAKGPVN